MRLSVQEEFNPPTHIEILEDKPFRATFGRRLRKRRKGMWVTDPRKPSFGKWVYTANLMKGTNYVRFWVAKNRLIAGMEASAEKAAKEGVFGRGRMEMIGYIFKVIQLLWETCEKPKDWVARWRFKREFFTFFRNNTNKAWELWHKILAHNGRLFFLHQSLLNFKLIQDEEWSTPTGPEDSSKILELIRKRGLMSLHGMN